MDNNEQGGLFYNVWKGKVSTKAKAGNTQKVEKTGSSVNLFKERANPGERINQKQDKKRVGREEVDPHVHANQYNRRNGKA